MQGQNKGMTDVWNIPTINNMAKERMGYPTQKPLPLYQQIITASSNPGDIVLDPFCGCATTPIAAEKLGRKWVGMDIWDGAHDIVLQRLADEGLAVPDIQKWDGRLITFGDVYYITKRPDRTDNNEIAAPKFELRTQRAVEPWQQLQNKVIRNILAEAQQTADGKICCAGCGRQLEIEFMHLDHILPKSDRGDNFITNRILLCGPCNMTKGNKLTLKGLHADNKNRKWMLNETRAKDSGNAARDITYKVKDEWGTIEINMLMQRANK